MKGNIFDIIWKIILEQFLIYSIYDPAFRRYTLSDEASLKDLIFTTQ